MSVTGPLFEELHYHLSSLIGMLHYLHDWTLYGINTVQKQVRIYMAFFLWKSESTIPFFAK